jgi:hypothetical protein
MRRKARPLSEVRAEDQLLRKPAPVVPAALEFFDGKA